jgi:hypothetical protein
MTQSKEYQYYRQLSNKVIESFQPREALQSLKLLRRKVGEDGTVSLEDKIELYKLFDFQEGNLENKLRGASTASS